jgi:NitT/TauT family transport system substrate-binding protein
MDSIRARRLAPYAALLLIAVASGVGLYIFNSRPPNALRVGLVTWIGYGPLFVAKERAFFREEGLPNVELKTLDGPGEREAAYQAGEIDFFPNTPDAFVILFASQDPRGRIVAALDESAGADGLVAKKDIRSIADLKGRTVGYQSGITSHFLLLYLLREKGGLSGRDVKQETLSAGDAGAAFMAGKLDAAVTWEPWLSKAKDARDAHLLATSADVPGLIVDVVLVSDRIVRSNPKAISGFIRAWNRAVRYLQENPDSAINIISRNLKINPDEAKEMLKTTHFLDGEASQEYLNHGLPNMVTAAGQLYVDNGVISKAPNLTSIVDTKYYK